MPIHSLLRYRLVAPIRHSVVALSSSQEGRTNIFTGGPKFLGKNGPPRLIFGLPDQFFRRCYRKFERSEILSRRSYFLENSIAERYFFLEKNIATRKFDCSRCYRSERLLLSMTTLSLTPRSQSPVGEHPWN